MYSRHYLLEWRVNVQRLKLENQKEASAVTHHNNATLIKAFKQWHDYTVYRANKVYQQQAELNEAKTALNTGLKFNFSPLITECGLRKEKRQRKKLR